MIRPALYTPLLRLGLVVVYAATAFLLAQLVSGERSTATIEETESTELPKGRSVELRIDLQASRSIAEWVITLDGIPLDASSCNNLSGSILASVEIREGSRLMLDLIPNELDSDAPLALRVELSTTTDTLSQTFWSASEMVEALSLDALQPQPTESL